MQNRSRAAAPRRKLRRRQARADLDRYRPMLLRPHRLRDGILRPPHAPALHHRLERPAIAVRGISTTSPAPKTRTINFFGYRLLRRDGGSLFLSRQGTGSFVGGVQGHLRKEQPFPFSLQSLQKIHDRLQSGQRRNARRRRATIPGSDESSHVRLYINVKSSGISETGWHQLGICDLRAVWVDYTSTK